nr:tetratricopeptide repeat protein [Granulicatella sp. 19428wC4_WM01]
MLKEPNYEQLGSKASALSNLRRYYDALDVLEYIRDNGKQDPKWHYRYGYIMICLENYEKAEKHLLKAVKLDDKLSDAWYLLSQLYRYFGDLSKEAWANERLKDMDSIEEDLVYDNFVTHQKFNKNYKLLANFECSSVHQKQQLIHSYQKMIYALEHVVTDYKQIPLLAIGLAETIKTIIGHIPESDERLSVNLVGELAYILDWFGVKMNIIEKTLYVFSYTIIVETHKGDEINPQHLIQLLDWMEEDNHQAIVDFFFSLLPEQQTYAYAEWLIQAFIHLQEYDCARDYLDKYVQIGQHQAFWQYWYGLVLVNQHDFQQAKDYLLKAVDLEKNYREAWHLLEYVYLHGLQDLKMANWAREQRELYCDNMK